MSKIEGGIPSLEELEHPAGSLSRGDFLRAGAAGLLAASVFEPLSALASPEQSPKQEAALKKSLRSWVDGSYVLPDDKRFLHNGTPDRLGYLPDTQVDYAKIKYYEGASYTGVLLGLTTRNHHLIGFMGFEDTAHNRFFVPYNFGDTRETALKLAIVENDSRNITGGVNKVKSLKLPTVAAAVNYLPSLKGQTIVVQSYTSDNGFDADAQSHPDRAAILQKGKHLVDLQLPLAQRLDNYIYATSTLSTVHDAQGKPFYPINQIPKTFDAHKLPWSQSLEIMPQSRMIH